ncbi:MAG: hypothetical protein J7L45_00315 [Candidatus Aenigmarchaeota archaeon]|nr:hypothetical protein [Candidatus Aenigmarchaeota archaeon]
MYTELKKLCGEISKEIDESNEKNAILRYLSRLEEKDQRQIIREAMDNAWKRYVTEYKENERKIFKKKPEEIGEPLKEAFYYGYILGDVGFIDRCMKEMSERGITKNTVENIPYKTYYDELVEEKYSFEERLRQILNGEGAKLAGERDE